MFSVVRDVGTVEAATGTGKVGGLVDTGTGDVSAFVAFPLESFSAFDGFGLLSSVKLSF
jgi:hypothetical protein